MLQYHQRNSSFELIEKHIERAGANTFQLRVPGMKPITTVDPENIKAILATQFHDYGKGEEFHAGWKYVIAKRARLIAVSW